MWEAVGLSEAAERVYRALVRLGRGTVQQCAAQTGLAEDEVRAALRALARLGLIAEGPDTDGAAAGRCGDGVWLPADPQVALGALLRRRRSELDRIRQSVDELSAEYREAQLRDDPARLTEVVRGGTAQYARVQDLLAGTESELLTLVGPPFLDPADDSLAPMERLLERGVKCRAVHAAEVLAVDGGYRQARRLADLGERIRVLPSVPVKLVIADRRRALLPLSTHADRMMDSAVLVRQSALTEALVALFEELWERATPLGTGNSALPGGAAATEAPARDEALLTLLAAGLKDEAIARQLHISERSLRRRISMLLGRLAVTSRFQAGAQAARRGWL
ncbi:MULTISPECIES: LuxR C-terminal-related transcriptional regulator [unclassified Streptomyces]|uniref:LuxR C-terminal-related transcriptional regulator n=1 Tax=unclassified Streptomyces TaxID=2593676 RepID=UPI002E20123C|nr:LuxR C-terminal-related transcriptional regulator [Streptomyces sp. NBC_01023]